MKKKKFGLALIAVLIIGLALGVGLWYAIVLTPRSLKPEFNLFNLEVNGNRVKFNIQNLGEADAHNVNIKVNGSWCPSIEIKLRVLTLGDAVILSTALITGADVLVTGDVKQYEKEWRTIREMQVLKLSDFMRQY